MLLGYGWLKPVVSSGRIGSASGASDSSGSAASIGQVIPRAPSDSLRLFGDGDVKMRPLLAAPTDRLCPVPTTSVLRLRAIREIVNKLEREQARVLQRELELNVSPAKRREFLSRLCFIAIQNLCL